MIAIWLTMVGTPAKHVMSVKVLSGFERFEQMIREEPRMRFIRWVKV